MGEKNICMIKYNCDLRNGLSGWTRFIKEVLFVLVLVALITSVLCQKTVNCLFVHLTKMNTHP